MSEGQKRWIRQGKIKLSRNLVVKEFVLYVELTHLSWWNNFQWSPFSGEELSFCGVKLAWRTVFVVKDNNLSLDESASNAFQAFHADVFPFPWKDDVVSQPVMAWNSGNAFAFLGPNASQMMSIDIYWKCFPVPTVIHSLTSGRIKPGLLYSVIAMTTTSLSTVLISTFCAPHPAAALHVQIFACLGPRGYNLAYFGWN